jgi:hypothetical protein
MKMTEQEKKFLVYALAFIVVYYLIVKPILVKLKLQKDPEVKKTEERKEAQLTAQIEADAKKQQPTKSTQEWQTIADQIYNDLRYSAIDDNKADAGYQVSRVKNDADFWTLYKLFGKRREYLFGIPSGGLMDLSQFIKSNLKESAIDTINRNYASKKIKFRF